jgi:hypothetical protein
MAQKLHQWGAPVAGQEVAFSDAFFPEDPDCTNGQKSFQAFVQEVKTADIRARRGRWQALICIPLCVNRAGKNDGKYWTTEAEFVRFCKTPYQGFERT